MTWRLTPPSGNTFTASILVDPNDIVTGVHSNRTGEWKPDPALSIADLVCPMYKLLEWDVELLGQQSVAGRDSV